MEPLTQAHLQTADRNRQLARALVAAGTAAAIQPSPHEWAVVVAFYAAVHYVDAYLWEQQRYEPHSHDQRRNAVDRVASMRPASRGYATLRDLAYRVRYVPGFRLTRAEAEAAGNRDLEQVAQAVRRALGIPDN